MYKIMFIRLFSWKRDFRWRIGMLRGLVATAIFTRMVLLLSDESLRNENLIIE